ncbi:MAG: hypothetical protein H7328_05600 [Bdellovibrio sp.]|nr:hypothetical protein [Bdellovibrio sp.]
MNAVGFQHQIYQLIQAFPSCSVVNADGALLASNDQRTEILTTTRLVAFQIIKKYLNPKPHDLFVMNDPENGGYSLSKLIFVAAIDPNLYLIWDDNCSLIDFKIPPTPLFEKSKKNEFVWKALIESNENSKELAAFFENEKAKIDVLASQSLLVKNLSQLKLQTLWLKATQEVFEHQFSNKAMGSFDCQYKTPTNQLIKLKFTSEERQNIKLISLDFTNSSLATTFHTASHVIESGLVQKLIQFYQVEKYLTQSILDKIKIILPPKSIASKAHPTGQFNHEIQSACSQLCQHNLTQLNSQIRKSTASFEIDSELWLELKAKNQTFKMNFHQKNIALPCLEKLIENKSIEVKKMQKNELGFQLSFQVLQPHFDVLKVTTKLGCAKQDDLLKINDVVFLGGDHPIKTGDTISIKWTF